MEEIPAYFGESRTTLKNASHDVSSGNYMSQSEQEVFDFDAIKGQYVKRCIPQVKPQPASNDALWLDTNHLIFIEFKNGRIDGVLNQEIIRKIYDSILIFMDAELDISWCRADYLLNISYTRQNMDYILVYNEEKFDQNNLTRQTKNGWQRQDCLQNSPNRNAMYRTLRKLGRQELIHFGLDRFQGYLFRAVYTLNRQEFEDYVIREGKAGSS